MKLRHLATALVVTLLTGPTLAPAQSTGHYPAGVEGIKGGTLPPPGVYLRDYNLFYFADRYPVGGPPNFDAFVYAQAPRLIWITDFKVLGGYYGMDVLVPFYYADVDFNTPGGGVSDNTFALGDIMFEPVTLSWHWNQFDLGLGYAFWAPNGTSGDAAHLLSKGFWSHMLTLGGTWYVDEQKTWALSLLNRYEIHHESRDDKPNTGNPYTPGNHLTMEWGLSKSLSKTIDVGVVGYYVQQITADSGAGTSSARSRVFGVGPEISTFCPKLKLFTSVRYLREFGARYRPEGNTVTLTLTKIF